MQKTRKKQKLPVKDGVVICEVIKGTGRTTVRIKGCPKLSASAKTIADAERKFVDLIWIEYELDEPIAFSYPQKEAPELAALLTIAPNDTLDAKDPHNYFTKGCCKVCQSGLGKRNELRL